MPIKDPNRRERRQRAADLYVAGSTVRSVAKDIGRSYAVTHKLLREARVPMRSRGSRKAPE